MIWYALRCINPRFQSSDAKSYESLSAYRLYQSNWGLLGYTGAVCFLIFLLSGFSFELNTVFYGYILPLTAAIFAASRFEQTKNRHQATTFIIGASAQIVLILMLFIQTSEMIATSKYSLATINLQLIDHFLGFDTQTYRHFAGEHFLFTSWLPQIYSINLVAVFCMPLLLGFLGLVLRLNLFVLALGLVVGLTASAQLFMPVLSYDKIVYTPTFLASCSLLYLWALWPVRIMRAPLVVLAISILLCIPAHQDGTWTHILTGLGMAACALVLAQRLGDSFKRIAFEDVREGIGQLRTV